MNDTKDVAARLEYLREEIRAERISYGEIAELQGLAAYIQEGDTELLQWADKADKDTITSWVCSNCIMLLANGESPVDMSDADEQDWWERFIATTENEDITIGMLRKFHTCGKQDDPDNEDECECTRRAFSSGICATCGTTVGGDREAVTFWFERGEA